ncbi:hypothetical protein DSECCO2_30630 [anaerobic digester metagenome]
MTKDSKIQNFGLLALLFIFLLASISMVSAHQPRLEVGQNVSYQNPIMVQNPEISQAFYGKLNGSPNYYKIISDKPFKLYINLLVPASPGITANFVSAEVLNSSGESILLINGTDAQWEPYFEEFGGDSYLKGPETTRNLSAGTYYVKVFNSNNQGKYAIAIGDIESFPVDESLKAIVTIPLLKEFFFAKPVTTLFLEFLGITMALGSLIVLLTMLMKSRKSEELTELTVKASGVLKPLIWLGITLTTAVWIYVMYKNPLNIMGLVNSMLLVVLIIISWYVGSKTSKMEFRKIPWISAMITVLLWMVFAFVAVVVI